MAAAAAAHAAAAAAFDQYLDQEWQIQPAGVRNALATNGLTTADAFLEFSEKELEVLPRALRQPGGAAPGIQVPQVFIHRLKRLRAYIFYLTCVQRPFDPVTSPHQLVDFFYNNWFINISDDETPEITPPQKFTKESDLRTCMEQLDAYLQSIS